MLIFFRQNMCEADLLRLVEVIAEVIGWTWVRLVDVSVPLSFSPDTDEDTSAHQGDEVSCEGNGNGMSASTKRLWDVNINETSTIRGTWTDPGLQWHVNDTNSVGKRTGHKHQLNIKGTSRECQRNINWFEITAAHRRHDLDRKNEQTEKL